MVSVRDQDCYKRSLSPLTLMARSRLSMCSTLSAGDFLHRLDHLCRTAPIYRAFFSSNVDEQGTIELRLYETTDQLSRLEIAQATTQIDFTDLQRVGLKILLELQVFNLGDRIPYFTDEADPTRLVTFYFELPVGAYNIAPEGESGAQRFIIQEGVIQVIYDTQPIFPGWPTPHIILRLSYFFLFRQRDY